MPIKNKTTNNKKEVLKRSFHQQVEIKKNKLSELAETKFLFWGHESLALEVLALTVYLVALLVHVPFFPRRNCSDYHLELVWGQGPFLVTSQTYA